MSMTLKDRIPKEFYSLFRTKNMDAYMQIVVALYEENNEVYASLGLTREECQIIIADTISKSLLIQPQFISLPNIADGVRVYAKVAWSYITSISESGL